MVCLVIVLRTKRLQQTVLTVNRRVIMTREKLKCYSWKRVVRQARKMMIIKSGPRPRNDNVADNKIEPTADGTTSCWVVAPSCAVL